MNKINQCKSPFCPLLSSSFYLQALEILHMKKFPNKTEDREVRRILLMYESGSWKHFTLSALCPQHACFVLRCFPHGHNIDVSINFLHGSMLS